MNENENVDQHVLAEDVSGKINFEFRDHFLVKPLDPIKVQKSFLKENTKKQTTVDDNGIEAVDYTPGDDFEVREVDSDYRKGVVLKTPTSFYTDEKVSGSIKVGDIVIFPDICGKKFDLLKNSRIIRYYDIIAVER